MFKSKTVFVLGAGASREVDVPIGKDLTGNISKLLNFDHDGMRLRRGDAIIYHRLKRMVAEEADKWRNNKLTGSARHISEAMELAPSIDTFLETFALDEERKILGKMGIARAILMAERGSKFAPTEEGRRPFKMNRVADTWYVSLAQLLFTGLAAGDVRQVFHNTSFIVFNYDRCLQVFLIRALMIYFELTERQASDIVREADIFHPYGNLGSVFEGDRERVSFGPDEADPVQVADRLKLFTETVEENDELAKIRTQIREAETIVFLGFAFHEQNMKLLSPPAPKAEKQSAVRRVLATAYGVSEPDAQVIRALIGHTLRGRPPKERDDYTIDIFHGECARFFAEYWRSFTA